MKRLNKKETPGNGTIVPGDFPISDIIGRKLTAPVQKKGPRYVTYPIRISRSNQGYGPPIYENLPTGRVPRAQPWDVPGLLSPVGCDRMDDGKRDSSVSLAPEGFTLAQGLGFPRNILAEPRIRLYNPEDWSFSNALSKTLASLELSLRADLARVTIPQYVTYPVSYSPSGVDVPMLDPCICRRCGNDVRFVSHCVPLAIDPGPRKVNNEGYEVVDANPTRIEIT